MNPKILDPRELRRLWRVGLWTRLAMMGGILVPGGVALAAEAGTAPTQGLLLAAAGAVLAVGAGRRAVRALDAIDHASEVPGHGDAGAARPRWLSPSRRPA